MTYLLNVNLIALYIYIYLTSDICSYTYPTIKRYRFGRDSYPVPDDIKDHWYQVRPLLSFCWFYRPKPAPIGRDFNHYGFNFQMTYESTVNWIVRP